MRIGLSGAEVLGLWGNGVKKNAEKYRRLGQIFACELPKSGLPAPDLGGNPWFGVAPSAGRAILADNRLQGLIGGLDAVDQAQLVARALEIVPGVLDLEVNVALQVIG